MFIPLQDIVKYFITVFYQARNARWEPDDSIFCIRDFYTFENIEVCDLVGMILLNMPYNTSPVLHYNVAEGALTRDMSCGFVFSQLIGIEK